MLQHFKANQLKTLRKPNKQKSHTKQKCNHWGRIFWFQPGLCFFGFLEVLVLPLSFGCLTFSLTRNKQLEIWKARSTRQQTSSFLLFCEGYCQKTKTSRVFFGKHKTKNQAAMKPTSHPRYCVFVFFVVFSSEFIFPQTVVSPLSFFFITPPKLVCWHCPSSFAVHVVCCRLMFC